jgi:hypothetical protein
MQEQGKEISSVLGKYSILTLGEMKRPNSCLPQRMNAPIFLHLQLYSDLVQMKNAIIFLLRKSK